MRGGSLVRQWINGFIPVGSERSQVAHRSASMIVGTLVFAAGIQGMIDASTTDKESRP